MRYISWALLDFSSCCYFITNWTIQVYFKLFSDEFYVHVHRELPFHNISPNIHWKTKCASVGQALVRKAVHSCHRLQKGQRNSTEWSLCQPITFDALSVLFSSQPKV